MTEWHLKSWPRLFEEAVSGRKKHDLRRADRAFRPGDLVTLQEWEPETQVYTGRSARFRITALTTADNPCALSDGGLAMGHCILSLELLTGWNIVAVDNFGHDYNGGRSEWLIGTAKDEQHARLFANAWNEQYGGDDASDFAVVRSADKPLYVFEGY